ncbi:MAG: hypothetical protein ABS910_05750 [Arthrobacter sp.]
MKTVISLCDLTGNMTAPWVEAGYNAFLVDPQHGTTRTEDRVTKFAGTIEDAMPAIGELIRAGDVAMVFGFPPCTDMAVSGARWFKDKYAKDKLFQAKAVMVAEQCRTIGRLSGAPWFVENPVSVLSSAFGKPQHTFHPADYTAYEAGDNYTKKTCLWTGGEFIMPQPAKDPALGAPDNRIHAAPPGPERANFRSATPMGFARAVFAANHQPALQAAA